MENKSCKILIGASGSVASIKLPLLIKSLLESSCKSAGCTNFEARVIVTECAKHFFDAKDLPADVEIYDNDREWSSWKSRGDPVIHIELAKWADIMIIAPLDANTLAKMAQGICDNLLTCTTRAWDMSKPLVFCPAMNTKMWDHPITAQQVAVLKSWGHIELPPISKTLVCGDKGIGAMAEVDTIVEKILSLTTSIDHNQGSE